jgi:ATP-binding cassette subfamily B protein
MALGLMLISSLAEVVSLAAVLPFLAVLTNPAMLWNQPLVLQWAPRLGISSAQELLLPITLAFAAAAIGAGAIRLLTLWLNGRLAAAIGSDLSCEAYLRTLYQPYAVQVARNSSALIASISTDVNRVINGVLNPLLLMLSSVMIVVALVATLLAIDWVIAMGAGLVIAIVYVAAMAAGKQPLHYLSQQQVELNQRLIQVLQEGLGAIRDVLLDGSQLFYANTYRQSDQRLRRAQAQSVFLASYPRLVMEPAGMALIALLAYLLVSQGEVTKVLPLLGALALGAQRLLPMAQKVYEGWASTCNAKDSLSNVLLLLEQPLPSQPLLQPFEPLALQESILLNSIRFRYGAKLPEVLKGLNLEIRRGERIGLIGSTGSGKSTLVDLLMGLLEPTDGLIMIDGTNLHDPQQPQRLAAWRAAIAHVPQSIYLADSSIAENIAFGIPVDQIDLERVRHAAQQAQISGFIESTPQGYATFAGERGIRFSGGQRQRIGIARALYKRAQVLVLDEATAALDNATEQTVIEAVEDLSRDLTIVMIAHRLSTVQRCDRLIHLEHGSIRAQGSPDQLLLAPSQP